MKDCQCVACSSEEDVVLSVTLESRSSSVGTLQGRSERGGRLTGSRGWLECPSPLALHRGALSAARRSSETTPGC